MHLLSGATLVGCFKGRRTSGLDVKYLSVQMHRKEQHVFLPVCKLCCKRTPFQHQLKVLLTFLVFCCLESPISADTLQPGGAFLAGAPVPTVPHVLVPATGLAESGKLLPRPFLMPQSCSLSLGCSSGLQQVLLFFLPF